MPDHAGMTVGAVDLLLGFTTAINLFVAFA
ncbi:MAG: hypothetical protein ACJAS3_000475 [Roseivirga sp.]|jgi:hypothetical protein